MQKELIIQLFNDILADIKARIEVLENRVKAIEDMIENIEKNINELFFLILLTS